MVTTVRIDHSASDDAVAAVREHLLTVAREDPDWNGVRWRIVRADGTSISAGRSKGYSAATVLNDVFRILAEHEQKAPAGRVRASEARKIQRGGRRMPGGVLPPEAAKDLQSLQDRGYAQSAMACIVRALRAAASAA